MITHNNFYFLNEVSVAMESPITHNTRGEVLTLQVEGTASAVKLQVVRTWHRTNSMFCLD